MKVLEILKIIVIEVKYSLDGFNSRLEVMDE